MPACIRRSYAGPLRTYGLEAVAARRFEGVRPDQSYDLSNPLNEVPRYSHDHIRTLSVSYIGDRHCAPHFRLSIYLPRFASDLSQSCSRVEVIRLHVRRTKHNDINYDTCKDLTTIPTLQRVEVLVYSEWDEGPDHEMDLFVKMLLSTFDQAAAQNGNELIVTGCIAPWASFPL